MGQRLASLDFDYKCAVAHDYKRQTYDEISAVMACSPSTIKNAVLRYRRDYQDLRGIKTPQEIKNPLASSERVAG